MATQSNFTKYRVPILQVQKGFGTLFSIPALNVDTILLFNFTDNGNGTWSYSWQESMPNQYVLNYRLLSFTKADIASFLNSLAGTNFTASNVSGVVLWPADTEHFLQIIIV